MFCVCPSICYAFRNIYEIVCVKHQRRISFLLYRKEFNIKKHALQITPSMTLCNDIFLCGVINE